MSTYEGPGLKARQKRVGSRAVRDRRTAEQWIDEYKRMGRNIWDRLPCETVRQYEYFAIYRDIGPTRTVRALMGSEEHRARIQAITPKTPGAVREAADKVPAGIKVYSSANCWIERVKAYDAFTAEAGFANKKEPLDITEAVAYSWEQRGDRLREKQHLIAELVLKSAYNVVSAPEFKVTPSDLRTWVDWASSLDQRAIDPARAIELAELTKPKLGRPYGTPQIRSKANIEAAKRAAFDPDGPTPIKALFEPEEQSDEQLRRVASGG